MFDFKKPPGVMLLFKPGGLREGVLLILACVLLSVIGILLPLLFPFCGLAITVLVAVVTNRHNAVYALMVLGAAALLTAVLLGTFVTLAILVEAGILGLLFGLCFKNGVPHGKILAAGLALAVALAAVNLAVSFLVLGENPYELAAAAVVADSYSQSLEQVLPVVVMLLPGSLITWAVVAAWAGFFLTAAGLKRMDSLKGPVPEFHRWRLPWPFVWAVIVGLALTLGGDQWSFEPVAVVGKNLLFVTTVTYMLGGLTLAVYLYRELTAPRWLKLLAVAGAVLNWPVTAVLLVFAGFLDAWVDCRTCFEQRRRES